MSEHAFSTVYSYGGGEALQHIFNALAMFFNNDVFESFVTIAIVLSFLFMVVHLLLEHKNPRIYLGWFIRYLVIFAVILQPKSIVPNGLGTMHIRDVITNKAYKVDNLPPGLVIPAALFSSIGYDLTRVFETVFSMPDTNYLPYHKYGTMFGAFIMSEMRNFRIQDPIFRENIESYISNCMMYDVMIGKKYDIQDLKASNNIWQLIEQNASNLRMFNYRNPGKGGRELVTCRVGIGRLASFFNNEPTLLSKKFATMAQTASESKAAIGRGIVNAIDLSLKSYGNLNETGTGSDQLRQILLINAFKDEPSKYGRIRAIQAQNTTWGFLGELSQMALPILHAIFQALIYGAFPIVILLAFFSKKLKILGTYFEMMLWLEIWPLLFAILNLLISVFARHSFNKDGITIGSIENIVSVQGAYAAAASSMGMLVPVLSYMIMKSGVSSFVHIAGQVMGATQHGVNTAAHEVISGNRTLDHVSVGDKSFNNVHGNKFDTSGGYVTGQMRKTLSDGRIQSDFLSQPDGEDRIYQGGAGITTSTGNFTVNKGQMLQDSVNQSITKEESVVAGLSKDVSTSQQDRHSKALEFYDAYMNSQSRGQNYDIGSSLKSSDTANTISRDAHAVSEDFGYQERQLSSHTIDGGIGGSVAANLKLGPFGAGTGGQEGKGLFGKKWLSGDISGGIAGTGGYKYTGSSSSEDTQSAKEDRTLSVNKEYTDLDERAINLAQNTHFGDSQMHEKKLAENLLHSNEEYTQKHEALSMHQNKLESMRELRDQLASVHIRGDDNAYGEFLEYVATRSNPILPNRELGEKRALRIIEGGGSERDQYMQDFAERHMPQQMWRGNKSFSDEATERRKLAKTQSQHIDAQAPNVDLGSAKQTLSNQAQVHQGKDVNISEGQEQYENYKHTMDQKITKQHSGFSASNEKLQDKVDTKETIKRDGLINASITKRFAGKQNPYFDERKDDDEND